MSMGLFPIGPPNYSPEWLEQCRKIGEKINEEARVQKAARDEWAMESALNQLDEDRNAPRD